MDGLMFVGYISVEGLLLFPPIYFRECESLYIHTYIHTYVAWNLNRIKVFKSVLIYVL